MSEHNGLPRRRVVWIILKLATPYQLLLTMSVKLTQFVTHSLNARALSSVLAAYLPWVARTHSPRGRRRYEHDTSTHMYRYDASGGGITAARSRRSSAT